MKREEYNGWTNYETWAANLHIANDQGTVDYWNEQAAEALKNAEADKTFTKEERATLNLCDQMKEDHENAAQDMLEASKAEHGMFADLLNAAMSEIDWHSIATHFIEAAQAVK